MGTTPPAHPRIYTELAHLWPLLSPAADYAQEVATFRDRFRRFGVEDGARILHLGSGGGSVDHHLKRHYRVTGVDLSREMLDGARSMNPEVDYRHGDLRDLRLGELFAGVLVHDAVSYMTSVEELEAAYRTAAAHLGPGGVLLTFPEELSSRLAGFQPRMEWHRDGDRILTLVELVHDPDPTDFAYQRIMVVIFQEGGELRVEVDRHPSGAFPLEVWVGAIERAGFHVTVEEWEIDAWEEGEEPLPLLVGVRSG